MRLAPSRVEGVGVFAVVDIPPDTDPFLSPNKRMRSHERSVTLSSDELERCPPAVVQHVLDFHDASADSGRLGVNAYMSLSPTHPHCAQARAIPDGSFVGRMATLALALALALTTTPPSAT